MIRVVGIDPGTVSIDLCGMTDGRLDLDQSWPTAEAVADPDRFIEILTAAGAPDLVIGPSGYGLPLISAGDATDADLRLAFLAPPDETGGIGGLRNLARRLAASGLPVVYPPGVIHLDTVPQHRKINRVDLGTADKLCAAILGVHDYCRRRNRSPEKASFLLIELGGAFSAALAVEQGEVVDGIGGTSGPIGWQAAGALDGEVAFLAGQITKAALFQGGLSSLPPGSGQPGGLRFQAYVEGAEKAARQLRCSAPSADEILLSGRHASDEMIRRELEVRLGDIGPVRRLGGFATVTKQGAQGAALLADGLLGGPSRSIIDRMRIRHASGTVLDNLIFLSPAAARRRLGIPHE